MIAIASGYYLLRNSAGVYFKKLTLKFLCHTADIFSTLRLISIVWTIIVTIPCGSRMADTDARYEYDSNLALARKEQREKDEAERKAAQEKAERKAERGHQQSGDYGFCQCCCMPMFKMIWGFIACIGPFVPLAVGIIILVTWTDPKRQESRLITGIPLVVAGAALCGLWIALMIKAQGFRWCMTSGRCGEKPDCKNCCKRCC